MQTLEKYLSLIKFSHTIFALPFACIGYFLALFSYQKSFDPLLFLKVLLCMVFARSAAMAFNRWADRDIDKNNPRTINREIPSGALHPNKVLVFVALNALLFIATAYFINPLCFLLAPVALAIIFGYSYTKRFSALCHLFLGLGLSLAPIGAYLAVTGKFDWLPIFYSVTVLTWVSGFDIIYALQDEDFDQQHDLFSIPSRFGKEKALIISAVLHTISAFSILVCAYLLHEGFGLSMLLYSGTAIFVGLLYYQHTLVKPNDLSKVNLAFFTLNGVASIILGVCTILDFYL